MHCTCFSVATCQLMMSAELCEAPRLISVQQKSLVRPWAPGKHRGHKPSKSMFNIRKVLAEQSSWLQSEKLQPLCAPKREETSLAIYRSNKLLAMPTLAASPRDGRRPNRLSTFRSSHFCCSRHCCHCLLARQTCHEQRKRSKGRTLN